MTIAVIDYGMGNLKSVSKALEHLGASVCVTRQQSEIENASKIILPGVGAFNRCMENLEEMGLVEIIEKQISIGKWFLGICLGYQLLFEESEEFGPVAGLGILPGRVVKFQNQNLKIPHMGWNQAKAKESASLFKGMEENPSFYFVHSYYVQPSDTSLIASTTDYGAPFASSIEKGNILGCQFHPEKSQKNGLQLLQNFIDL